MQQLPNYAGRRDVDDALIAELDAASINPIKLPFPVTGTEVHTAVMGELHGWSFTRAWRYWVAEGPGLPPYYAKALHRSFGTVVRVGGHCGAPSPLEFYNGFAVGRYHVDTLTGLQALSAMLSQVVREARDDDA